ncbi:hypothetical protein GWK47_006633 [Chionoecetes opilio]|uniref:Uncharacterized protein n=1 Tax=Chionoecetes opilio TaxID=41210 RepID=A0A8J5CU53_CHIOP|nr:hypothetical protein GWK47_006633 [Chionoecetes opilio]
MVTHPLKCYQNLSPKGLLGPLSLETFFFSSTSCLIPEAKATQTLYSHIPWEKRPPHTSFVSTNTATSPPGGKRWQITFAQTRLKTVLSRRQNAATGTKPPFSWKQKKTLQESVNFWGSSTLASNIPATQKVPRMLPGTELLPASRTSWALRGSAHSTSHKSAPRWKTPPRMGLLPPVSSASLTGV